MKPRSLSTRINNYPEHNILSLVHLTKLMYLILLVAIRDYKSAFDALTLKHIP